MLQISEYDDDDDDGQLLLHTTSLFTPISRVLV